MATYIFVSKGELNGKNCSGAFLFLSGIYLVTMLTFVNFYQIFSLARNYIFLLYMAEIQKHIKYLPIRIKPHFSTVNSEIFMRVLFLHNFADVNLAEMLLL